MRIPPEHPRYASLMQRERLVRGFEAGMTVLQGLIAHGRGEAFDYLLGEKTTPLAAAAIRAGAAMLMLARKPVISVNGNTAVLCPEELARLGRALNAPLEVNLFYRSEERARRIAEHLRSAGAERVLWRADAEIEGLESERRKVSSSGIYASDVVLVAVEDGDRTGALKRLGKKVVAIDLNPLSRTAQEADVTIVDEVTRALPLLTAQVHSMQRLSAEELEEIARFDNAENLRGVLEFMAERLLELSRTCPGKG